MDFGDKVRRRLDAEAFEILEREDGFRLQTLVDFRSRANRSHRLLIDELRRNNLITKRRYQTLTIALKIETNHHDSLLLDQTLGEESYEDSVVDVAPVPRAINEHARAPVGARKTLVQGSRLDIDVNHASSLDQSEGSRSDSEQLSVSDASSFTMHPKRRIDGATALIGAPETRRNAQPDERSLTSVSMYPHATKVGERPLTQLLSQTEALLAAHIDGENKPLRIRLIARNFAHLSMTIQRYQAGYDESIRMAQICQSIVSLKSRI